MGLVGTSQPWCQNGHNNAEEGTAHSQLHQDRPAGTELPVKERSEKSKEDSSTSQDTQDTDEDVEGQ